MDKLFEEVKNYLDMTWKLTLEEEQKLNGIIKRGRSALIGKIGDCDFEKDTQEKALLLNYCMYERSGCLVDFWIHYRGEIISLRMRNKVKKYEQQQNGNV